MLSQKQIDGFFDNGYLVFKTTIFTRILDQVVRDMDIAYSGRYTEPHKHGSRLQDLWKDSISAKHISLYPGILSILYQLYKRKPLPFQTLNFPIGTQQSMHSDTVHFNSFPSNFMCGVWIALEDIDGDNGPLCYCPGSHKLPEYTMQDVGKGITHDNYKHYEQFIRSYIEDNRLNIQTAEIKKGEGIIWHGNLLHGGSPHKNKQRTRYSQVTHYYFDGCTYYTPMLSTPEQIHYREPEWIEYVYADSLIVSARDWLARNNSN